MRISAFFLSLILSLSVVLPMAVFAQESIEGTIIVKPLIEELEGDSGTSLERELFIQNIHSLETYDIRIEAFDISIAPETHNVTYFPDESRGNTLKSLASWFRPETSSFVLQPNEERTVSYTLDIPTSVAPGDYYASINVYFDAQEQEGAEGSVQVRRSIGSLLLLTVGKSGELLLSGDDITLSELVLDEGLDDTQVVMDVTNNGLSYLHVKPHVTLVDAAGEVYFQRLGESYRVFPGETMEVHNQFPNRYLSTVTDLSLKYVLWEKNQKEQYFEKIVPLSGNLLFVDYAKGVLLFLIILGGVWIIRLRLVRR